MNEIDNAFACGFSSDDNVQGFDSTSGNYSKEVLKFFQQLFTFSTIIVTNFLIHL